MQKTIFSGTRQQETLDSYPTEQGPHGMNTIKGHAQKHGKGGSPSNGETQSHWAERQQSSVLLRNSWDRTPKRRKLGRGEVPRNLPFCCWLNAGLSMSKSVGESLWSPTESCCCRSKSWMGPRRCTELTYVGYRPAWTEGLQTFS
jgi:hypothetical protein